jgi:hypothetical protein
MERERTQSQSRNITDFSKPACRSAGWLTDYDIVLSTSQLYNIARLYWFLWSILRFATRSIVENIVSDRKHYTFRSQTSIRSLRKCPMRTSSSEDIAAQKLRSLSNYQWDCCDRPLGCQCVSLSCLGDAAILRELLCHPTWIIFRTTISHIVEISRTCKSKNGFPIRSLQEWIYCVSSRFEQFANDRDVFRYYRKHDFDQLSTKIIEFGEESVHA